MQRVAVFTAPRRATVAGLALFSAMFILGDAVLPMLKGESSMEGWIAGLFFAAPALAIAGLLWRVAGWPSILAALWMFFAMLAHYMLLFGGEGAESAWVVAGVLLLIAVPAIVLVLAVLSFAEEFPPHVGSPLKRQFAVAFAIGAIILAAAWVLLG
ncbi:MAG: hypothetical protein FJ319_01950 [SAR202 cluster bacterium]|nr:hypothetical protein [SAR202 cluster bacterium]